MLTLQAMWLRYIWNSKTFVAILWVSPAILTTLGSFLMSLSIGRDIADIDAEVGRDTRSMAVLEQVTGEVERLQLARASMLLVLTGQNSDDVLRYTADQLYRLSAQKWMRRVLAVLYPDDWQQRIERHQGLVAKGYRDREAVDELQHLEDNLILDASKAMTTLQECINTASTRREKLDGWRNLIQLIGYSFIQILTILIFFWKTEASGRK